MHQIRAAAAGLAQGWVAPRCPPSRAPRASRLPAVRGSRECVKANGHGGRPRPSLAATGDHQTAGHKPAPASVASAFARRAARSAGATRAQPGCTHALAHVTPACTDYASHASSACLPCGAGARLGAGVGEAQRAGQSAGAYPANRVRSRSRCGCRRVQEVERVSDLRVARARPEDGHCAPDCSRQRACRRSGSSVAAA